MKNIGIQIDPITGDLYAVGGVLAFGDITLQNQTLIITSQPGAFKLSPTVGVGAANALLDNDELLLRADITAQLRADGQTVRKITRQANHLYIDANY